LKPILRLATRKDLDETRKLTPESAMQFTRERADRLRIKMTVLQADVQFGGNKVIVYFSAPGRVDFRDLVKELASGLKARVELKQVGARDEAKLVGGIGICGREFCCSSFLREFVPVSIKMAKNQNLALNPSKVSGGCGRLLCCLTYENDTYTELRRKLPPRGARVRSVEDDVVGDVVKGDVLNQIVVIETDEGRQLTVPVKAIEIVERKAQAAEDESEADAWGEDIDLAALTHLEAEGAGGQAPRGGSKREARSGEGGRRDGNRPGGNRERGPQQGSPRGERRGPGQESRPKERGGAGGGNRDGGRERDRKRDRGEDRPQRERAESREGAEPAARPPAHGGGSGGDDSSGGGDSSGGEG
jgi:cell fate regulator YaaT (PSP1 superfamily)